LYFIFFRGIQGSSPELVHTPLGCGFGLWGAQSDAHYPRYPCYPHGQQPMFLDYSAVFSECRFSIPAPESSHAIAATIQEALRAKEEGKEKCILFNLSGHGLIDMAAYDQYLAGDLLNYNLPEEEIAKNIKELEKII